MFLSTWVYLDSVFTRTEHVSCHSRATLGVVTEKAHAPAKNNPRKSMLMAVFPASEKDFL